MQGLNFGICYFQKVMKDSAKILKSANSVQEIRLETKFY